MERILTKLIFFICVSIMSISVSKAQDTACLNELIPCLQYLNSTQTPSSSCCTPLKSLIKSDPSCLCDILGGNSVTKQAGVDSTQATKLPQRCGEKVNPSLCQSSQKQRTTTTSFAGESSIAKTGIILLLAAETMWIIS